MKKKESDKIIPFVSEGTKKTKRGEGQIVEHGKLGKLDFEVYRRGVIHIFDKKFIFKKDCVAFEDAIDELNLSTLKDGEEVMIQGSGDNDNLVFKHVDGDIEISLREKSFNMISKLKRILNRGKKKKVM